ncbi:DUF4261 domain-containing protein [Paenibacillus nasutitermitis]|uniref:DUF4261 domain-containing protein n=1 Tax=Paenibacillus nasutitermitis TaxID=1652958 RepID=A0A916ZE48_9BACL|nr:DUF4261 domain-containing protein [Paenibacillus nasutitermitis]GGD90384.1 hypothetical protein GCM10010911_56330 [Paenibacillus nasutitermitis]
MKEFEDGLETAKEEGQEESGFARVYMVELLYKEKPVIDRDKLLACMQANTGEVQLPEKEEAADGGADLAVWEANEADAENQLTLMFFHLNHMISYEEGPLPAQTCVFSTQGMSDMQEYESAIQQSWNWKEARQTVRECRHSLLFTDFCASGLEYKERLELFQNALKALLEAAPCEAIYWKMSDKFVHPQHYLQALTEGQQLFGALNIRLYQVKGSDSGSREMLMDSSGLAALGLPDVQCHFFDLEPGEMASSLLDLAYYIFDKGDLVKDGETIGMTEDQRWRCQHQYSIAAPRRVVLDIDPGEPYYAGTQHRDGMG